MSKRAKNREGFGLVEVVIGASIISICLVGVIAAFGNFLRLGDHSIESSQATFLFEETAEVLRFLRDSDWDNLATLTPGVDYFLVFNGSSWSVSTQNIFIDGLFERKFRVANVSRDVSDNISVSGSNDPDTRLFNVTVSWLHGATTTRSAAFYLSNLFNT